VSSKSSPAAQQPCFAARRAAPTPSSTASATADAAREALCAVSAMYSFVCSNIDSAIIL
jgi:hypothetical protein